METSENLVIEEVDSVNAPVELLLEADPSLEKIRTYLPASRCFAARLDGKTVGAYVLLPLSPTSFELMNIVVTPALQGKGFGTQLLEHVIRTARNLGATRLEVGTGSFGYQLAFYQKAGFRVRTVAQDFFLNNYPAPIIENGIQLKDMLRLALDFQQ